MENKARTWRTTESPIQAHEITDAMLAQARKDADKSWLAQTIWPSRWYGKDYLGSICLVVNSCAAGNGRPEDADKDAQPLLTVLPSRYLENQVIALEDHKAGNCGAYCIYEPWNQQLLAG